MRLKGGNQEWTANMPKITEAKHAGDACHWYRQDGTPVYTIIGKNGRERNTTLADARKLCLVPSVTTICREADAPGLTNWKVDQGILAALTLPRDDGESEEDWLRRVKEDAKETARKAAERGTQIHAWVQQYFEGLAGLPDEASIYGSIVSDLLHQHEIDASLLWVEHSFAAEGYGGKVDMFHPAHLVLDIKTTDKPLNGLKTWDNHAMQVAAYRQGLGMPLARGGIIFVSTKEVEAKLIWIPEEALERGWRMFCALEDYWYAKTGL